MEPRREPVGSVARTMRLPRRWLRACSGGSAWPISSPETSSWRRHFNRVCLFATAATIRVPSWAFHQAYEGYWGLAARGARSNPAGHSARVLGRFHRRNVIPRAKSLLPLGHTPTENSCQRSLGEKWRSELEHSRCVVLISKFRALCRCLRVPTPAAMAARHRAFATTPCDGPRIVAF